METNNFPMDIISNHILPNLPTKTLCRFKCVSKSLLTIISSSQFIHLHSLNYQLQNNSTLFVTGIDSTLYSFNLNPLQSTPMQFSLSRFFPVPTYPTIEIIGSCKGLLCLASSSCTYKYYITLNQIILLNPFTRNWKEVPFHHLNGQIVFMGLGFGFDDVNHDYKLVSVTSCVHLSQCIKRVITLYVAVYSFNNNTWKFIDHSIPSRHFLECKSWSVLINNHLLHWLIFGEPGFTRIGSFDLRIDNWIEDVPLPDPFIDANRGRFFSHVCLRNLVDGRLCFGDFCRPNIIDLWIMNEYGVKETWSLYRISTVNFPVTISKKIYPVALHKDELVLKRCSASNLICVYNFRDSSITEIELDGVAPFFQPYECKESLVIIPGSPQIEAHKTVEFDDATSNRV